MLKEIVAYKKSLIKTNALHLIKSKAFVVPKNRSFYKAIKRKGLSFICEVKPGSPSKGIINKNINPTEVAHMYAPFADSISVLVDEKYFFSSPKNLELISNSIELPILYKDIIVSPMQVYHARGIGAHAVLLMLSVLDDNDYNSCLDVARSLNMDVVCEVHNEDELKRAIKLKANIIGINNRNLHTLKIDMSTTARLIEKVPHDCALITESGFHDHKSIKAIPKGIDGLLVGTALMRAKRIDLKLRELIFNRIKICGLTNKKDAQFAYDCGAYYGGLNFYQKSKRKVCVDIAQKLVNEVPLKWAGVFVNQSIDEIIDINKKLNLSVIQLHGNENDEFIKDLRRVLPTSCEIWRAFRIKDKLPSFSKGLQDKIIFDSFSAEVYGGTGQSFNWKLLKANENLDMVIIAGGIREDNVVDADSLNPFAIDIASGVEEDNPRKKSLHKIKKIFSSLRGR